MRVQSGGRSRVRRRILAQTPLELVENLILTFLIMALIPKLKVTMQVSSKSGLIVRV